MLTRMIFRLYFADKNVSFYLYMRRKIFSHLIRVTFVLEYYYNIYTYAWYFLVGDDPKLDVFLLSGKEIL